MEFKKHFKYKITFFLFVSITLVLKAQDGSYDTTYGEVIFLKDPYSQEVVGTYAKAGTIYMKPAGLDNYKGIFSNGNSSGDLELKFSNGRFDGKWNWKGSSTIGNWTGKIIPGVRREKSPLSGEWNSTVGQFKFIQNSHGHTVGFLYINQSTRLGVIRGRYYSSSNEFRGTIQTNYTAAPKPITFKVDRSYIFGSYTKSNNSRQTIMGTVKNNKNVLKVKIEKIKLYQSNDLDKTETGKVKITARVFSGEGDQRSTINLYKDNSNYNYKENRERIVNSSNSFQVFINTLLRPTLFHDTKMDIRFYYDESGKVFNIRDGMVAQTVNLEEIWKYLKGIKSKSQFSNGPDGRKIIPGSDQTFWLETNSSGKKYARGYGFIQFTNRLKFGYFYTLEIQ